MLCYNLEYQESYKEFELKNMTINEIANYSATTTAAAITTTSAIISYY